MALSTLGEWTGSAIISNLVDVASSYSGERMLPADIEEELNRLRTAIPKITAVMSVAEALKFKHPNSGVNVWLQQFKQAFLAADDVLDELKYWELADMVKNRDQVSEYSSSILGSLKRKFLGSNINKDTLERLREAVKMLDLAAKDVGAFLQFASALHAHGLAGPDLASSRETTSFLIESKVCGRENERAKVIEWLKDQTSHAHISAFSIVGVGGLGKTTLAQLIYEEMNRENHFDKIIWVCVSTSFSVEDITRKVLEELGERIHGGGSLNGLQKSLKEKILSKKVLFILDDVWNDDKMCDWDRLMAPLRFVQQGSRILLTTRMKSVAEMLARVLDVAQECLHLEGLEEKELLSLFNKYAFSGRNPNNHKDLQNIGKDIAKKLWGSPLAAKVIGSLLNSNMDFNYWKRIMNCDSLINLEDAKEVADVLKLSYFNLPTDLQECFRFCSIFPEDYQYEKNYLIKMWMASGFLRNQSRAEERPEDTGEKYWNHLIRKSFFEPHPHKENYCIMHDLIHELAQNVSEGECYGVESNAQSINIPITTQHVYIHECEIKRVFHLRNLRTMIIIMSGQPDQFVFPNGALRKSLRVLDIYHSNFLHSCVVLEEIGSLIHLRSLSSRGTSLVRTESLLPHSFCKLHHLQVLEWNGKPFETTQLANLVSLRYMDLPDEMMQTIKGIHNLTCLQELNFIVTPEKSHQIDELKTLHNLQKLSIKQIENVGDPTEAKNAELSKKRSLISLSLEWSTESNLDNHEQIIDNLQPSPNLIELSIKYYNGHISPIWMRNLPGLNLSSLKLFVCPLWKDLPSLAQMPNLRKLDLNTMSEVKEVDYSFDSTIIDCAFPSLEKLQCRNMPKWQSWAGPLNYNGFPNLRELVIYHCPNLVVLPALPLSLVSFDVLHVGLNSLPYIYNSSHITTTAPSSLNSSLSKVWIADCPNLKSLNGFLQQENLDLQSLVELHISTCKNLVQLPTDAFGNFESLTDLYICGCPKLVALDSHRSILPANLRRLDLGDCGEFDVQLLESASGVTTLHNLTIGNSHSICRIPSSENVFQSLTELRIYGCDKVVEYSCMEYAQRVNPENNTASLKISTLDISHLSLLFIEPLRSLTFVSRCKVNDCAGMETFPEQWLLQNSSTLANLHIYDASSLRSLPATMVSLTALERLYIDKAILLEEVPEFPANLRDKNIRGAGGCQLV